MNVSIMDIGTKSLKHYIFKISQTNKELISYKRYSEVNLGENNNISIESEDRLLSAIHECLNINREQNVKKIKIVGTEIFRSSAQAKQLTHKIKEVTGYEVEILDQEKEAFYLYSGFVNLIEDITVFAAANIGGGSTEIILGDNKNLNYSQKLPFGVNFLKNNFGKDHIDWVTMDKYLENNINSYKNKAKQLFITGALDFLREIAPQLGFNFKDSLIKRHPFYIDIKNYRALVEKLRITPIEMLRGLYAKDPDFANNVAIGQSVYLKVAEKLGSDIIIPSDNDLTDGIIRGIS